MAKSIDFQGTQCICTKLFSGGGGGSGGGSFGMASCANACAYATLLAKRADEPADSPTQRSVHNDQRHATREQRSEFGASVSLSKERPTSDVKISRSCVRHALYPVSGGGRGIPREPRQTRPWRYPQTMSPQAPLQGELHSLFESAASQRDHVGAVPVEIYS